MKRLVSISIQSRSEGAQRAYKIRNMKNAPVTLLLLFSLSLFANCSTQKNNTTDINNDNHRTSLENNPLKQVETIFKKKLEYYQGEISSLKLENDKIYVNWTSKKCDWFKEEVIDLAISIKRGYSKSFKSIEINRSCDSKSTTISINGEEYKKYITGKITDAQFTKGIR